MTREEEIRNAIDTIIPIPPSKKRRTYEQVLMAYGFEAGVNWADKNPNINSLWHTPDEPPEPKERLIIHCDEKSEWNSIDQLVYYTDSEYPWDRTVKIYSILHWAYAKDLVPNFNEEL